MKNSKQAGIEECHHYNFWRIGFGLYYVLNTILAEILVIGPIAPPNKPMVVQQFSPGYSLHVDDLEREGYNLPLGAETLQPHVHLS